MDLQSNRLKAAQVQAQQQAERKRQATLSSVSSSKQLNLSLRPMFR
jgi:hypothetical protein